MEQIFHESFYNKIKQAPNLERKREINSKTASEQVKLAGYQSHKEKHDPKGTDPKIYHTSEHLRTMERHAKHIAEALNLSPEQLAMIQIAIAWHDTVIEYDQADPNNLLAMIRRHRGAYEGDKPNGAEGNEAKSSQMAEAEMRKANDQAGEALFTEEQIRTVSQAINATYPDVDLGIDFKGALFEEYPYYKVAIQQNPALGKLFQELKEQGIVKGPLFSQPHLEKQLEQSQPVPREVLITALADFGTVGLGAKKDFFKEGDDEMRELYASLRRPEIMRRLLESDEDTDQTDRKQIAEAFIRWLESQCGFAAWQSLRFEKIICLLMTQNRISPEQEQALRGQFSRYLDNIRATRDRAKKLKTQVEQIKATAGEKEAFLYLARNMHYEI